MNKTTQNTIIAIYISLALIVVSKVVHTIYLNSTYVQDRALVLEKQHYLASLEKENQDLDFAVSQHTALTQLEMLPDFYDITTFESLSAKQVALTQ